MGLTFSIHVVVEGEGATGSAHEGFTKELGPVLSLKSRSLHIEVTSRGTPGRVVIVGSRV